MGQQDGNGISVSCEAVTGMIMYYLLNDDATIESILSGSLLGTPDGHSIYLRYPLSGLLSLLYRLIPSVSWYSLVLLGCYLFTGVVIGNVLVRCYRKQGKKAWGCLAFAATLILFLVLPEFIKLHYTVCAAVLAGGAILHTMTGKNIWISPLALLFVYCIRKDVFLLALPFWLVAMLWKLREREWKRLLRTVAIFGAFSVVLMGLNAFFYRSDAWQEYEQYNDSRTKVYDYSWFKQYEEIADAYQEYGISYKQYQMLDNYALTLDGELDAAFFDRVYEATTRGDWVDTPLHTVKRMMVQYRNWIFQNPKEPFSWIAI